MVEVSAVEACGDASTRHRSLSLVKRRTEQPTVRAICRCSERATCPVKTDENELAKATPHEGWSYPVGGLHAGASAVGSGRALFERGE